MLITLNDDQLIFQLRDIKRDIYFPGKIGLFGGAVEPNETAPFAAKRELHEELDLDVDAVRLTLILKCEFRAMALANGGKRIRHFFHLNINDAEYANLVLQEGQSLLVFDSKKPPSISDLVASDVMALAFFTSKINGNQINPS